MEAVATRALVVFALVAGLGCDEGRRKPAETRSTSAAASVAASVPTAASAPKKPLAKLPSQAAIDGVVAEQRAALVEGCFAQHPHGEGGVELQLIAEIHGDGRVKDATVAGGGAAFKRLRRCVSEESRAWRFPRSREGGTITASIELGPRSGD